MARKKGADGKLKATAQVSIKTSIVHRENGKDFRKELRTYRFRVRSVDKDAAEKLLLRVRKDVKFTVYHSLKVAHLESRGARSGSAASGSGSGSKALPMIKMTATVEVTAQLPQELEARVARFPDWPVSMFSTRHRKVECGCAACKRLQEEEAQAAGRRARASRRRTQATGFWTPTNFVKHVTGWRFPRGRRPEGVPPLGSEAYVRLVVEGGEGRDLEMAPSELKKAFGFRWQHSTQD